ncbi:uncharacterized protein LOC127837425 [Dreissena polymorpha]|uniref:uncharacterized protein LOC127837425 n=1 Tax=Dreissena polymorpha TaxID=45954 RepID=UPI002264B335|nr:uncharacterized protein LOC127837425 [Dreissena polymorpha]
MDVSFKCNAQKRMESTSKSKPTLFKKAFELSQIAGYNVFVLTQDKHGNRCYFGTGPLKTQFLSQDGLTSGTKDSGMIIQTHPDRTVSVTPSPSKPNSNQTYLPASTRLQDVSPVVSLSEEAPQTMSPPNGKPKKGRSLSFRKKSAKEVASDSQVTPPQKQTTKERATTSKRKNATPKSTVKDPESMSPPLENVKKGRGR